MMSFPLTPSFIPPDEWLACKQNERPAVREAGITNPLRGELTFDKLFDISISMIANVSTLLRDFPRIRRTALSGEDVIIKTREGTLRLSADKPLGTAVLGRCRDLVIRTDDDIDKPTTSPDEWDAQV